MTEEHCTRENVIEKTCRYYQGEDNCPYDDSEKSLFWGAEKMHVDYMTDEYSEGEKLLVETSIEEARRNRLDNELGVFYTIVAILYNRYQNWTNGNVDEFRRWLKERYIDEAPYSKGCFS